VREEQNAMDETD